MPEWVWGPGMLRSLISLFVHRLLSSQRAVARRRRAGGGAAHTLRCCDAGVWRRRDAMKLSISAAHKVAWHAYVTRNLRLHPLIGYVGTCAFTREGAYTFIRYLAHGSRIILAKQALPISTGVLGQRAVRHLLLLFLLHLLLLRLPPPSSPLAVSRATPA